MRERERKSAKAQAKAIPGSRRRRQHHVARAFDLVTLSLAIWLGVLVAAEGIQKLGDMVPDSGMMSSPAVVQAAGG